MSKIVLFMMCIFSLTVADTFIMYHDKTNINGEDMWSITICNNGHMYIILKHDPVGIDDILRDFRTIKKIDTQQPCPTDFKDPSQFPKD